MNAIRIRDAQTLEIVETPRMDVCRRRSCGNENNNESFWTLEPDVPFTLIKMNFRPYGGLIVKNLDWEQLQQLGSERWRMCVMLGMHSLEPGKEYVIDIHENLHVFYWKDVPDNMNDDDDDSEKKKFSEDRHDSARKPHIPVDVAEGVRFRVVD